jgi:predicted transposase YbfD/YdcC
VAVDGTTLRGARAPDGGGRAVHLLAAMDHATRAVLVQRQVGGAPEEVPAFAPLLAGLELAGVVVTADALHTHPEAAEFLVAGKQAHYLFQVKANQPTLLARLKRLPWHRVPVLDRTRDQAHGRIEHRTLKVVTVHHLGFPHAAQVLQVTRKTRALRTRRWRIVTVYAITSLGFAQARPARLADLLRGHWAIEALHQLRDVTFCEDASQVRSGAGPSVMACLRNLVIGVLCRVGPVNLAAALRHHARNPARPLATLRNHLPEAGLSEYSLKRRQAMPTVGSAAPVCGEVGQLGGLGAELDIAARNHGLALLLSVRVGRVIRSTEPR